MSDRGHRGIALRALRGLGDRRHEWHDDRLAEAGVYHVRRRMGPDEQKRVGNPLDIRGTEEEIRRCAIMAGVLGLPFETVRGMG